MADWLEVILRTLFAMLVLFVLTKLLGKKQVSQLSFFEYITGITIGSLAAYISLDMDTNWHIGLISLCVWVAVSLLFEFLQLKSRRIRGWMDSKSTVLIKDGKVLEDNLKKERLTIDEFMQQLRQKNLFQASDVEFAVMEPSGEISILLKKENQPLTPAHLGIKIGPAKEPQTVIMDGNVMDEPLSTFGLSREWLKTELGKIGVTLDNVFLGQVDSYGQLYVDLFDDKIEVPLPQTKAALLAQLKKCEADLEMFSLSTNSEIAKASYQQCSEILEQVIQDVRSLLIR
ncbi:hypothetical protein D3C73_539950 [compost metagenome]